MTARAKSYLRNLLKYGLDDFEDQVGSVVRDAGCACARYPVVERKPYEQYDLGKDRCTRTGGACGIAAFLANHRLLLVRVLTDLQTLPESEKTVELGKAKDYLARYLTNPGHASDGDPCLKVGDLILALESARVPDFYTLNYRESIHLCRLIGQNLIYRPANDDRGDRVCPLSDRNWRAIITGAEAKELY